MSIKTSENRAKYNNFEIVFIYFFLYRIIVYGNRVVTLRYDHDGTRDFARVCNTLSDA